jgi:hypothetical protein
VPNWCHDRAAGCALSDGIEAFVIASSDRDFAPVALALRERGKTVIGAGGARAGLTFQRACTRFVVLEEADVVPIVSGPIVAVPVQPTPAFPDNRHRRAVEKLRENGGDMLMEDLARALGKKPEGTARWQSALKECPELFRFAGEAKNLRVRLTANAAKLR